jgi:hypothetical protein
VHESVFMCVLEALEYHAKMRKRNVPDPTEKEGIVCLIAQKQGHC